MKKTFKLLGIIAGIVLIGLSTVGCDWGPAEVTSVTVSPANVDVERGGRQQFTARVEGTNNPPQDVTWSLVGLHSTGTAINSAGVLTVGNTQSGTVRIRATSTFNTRINGTANVSVLVPSVTSVTVSPTNATVQRGET